MQVSRHQIVLRGGGEMTCPICGSDQEEALHTTENCVALKKLQQDLQDALFTLLTEAQPRVTLEGDDRLLDMVRKHIEKLNPMCLVYFGPELTEEERFQRYARPIMVKWPETVEVNFVVEK